TRSPQRRKRRRSAAALRRLIPARSRACGSTVLAAPGAGHTGRDKADTADRAAGGGVGGGTVARGVVAGCPGGTSGGRAPACSSLAAVDTLVCGTWWDRLGHSDWTSLVPPRAARRRRSRGNDRTRACACSHTLAEAWAPHKGAKRLPLRPRLGCVLGY